VGRLAGDVTPAAFGVGEGNERGERIGIIVHGAKLPVDGKAD
jgi:hypothetical protein